MQTDLTIAAEIKLYYDLSIPDAVDGPAPLMLAVHGYGAHKRYMMREARAIAPEGFVIASLQAPHQHFRKTDAGYRVGFGWLTDHRPEDSIDLHHSFVLNVIDRLTEQGIVDPSRIYLFGFSQACALNFRFAFTYPEIASGVIGVCGGVPGDIGSNPRFRQTQAEVLYLYNTDDEFYSLEKYESYAQSLEPLVPNLTTGVYDCKHEIIEPMRTDIRKWIGSR